MRNARAVGYVMTRGGEGARAELFRYFFLRAVARYKVYFRMGREASFYKRFLRFFACVVRVIVPSRNVLVGLRRFLFRDRTK